MAKVCVVGAINWDTNSFVDHLPRPGEEVLVLRREECPGGTGANVAVAAARLMPPGEVAMVGALGTDAIAKRQRAILAAEGVDCSGVLAIDGPSGQAHIAIDGRGENTILTLMGANARLTPEALRAPEVARLLAGAEVVAVSDPPIDTLPAIAALAPGATVLWDPGVRVAEAGPEHLAAVDWLVLNSVEVSLLPAKLSTSVRVVEKLGARGCRLRGPGGAVEAPGVDLGRLGLSPVSTVGCGDAFLGALAASLAGGLGERESLERANLAGALNAARPETRGSPTRDELERAMAVLAGAASTGGRRGGRRS